MRIGKGQPMLTVAICDDNNVFLEMITGIVDKAMKQASMEHEIQGFLHGKAFLAQHRAVPFDVVFLDIVMPDIDGFEVAKEIRKISEKTYIIFVTTESSMVYDSFDFQPFYFIPKNKPKIIEEKLKYVVNKLSLHITANEKVLISGAYENKKFVSPNEILYLKSSVNNIEYHMTDKTVQTVRGRLDDISQSLNSYIFARTHNRFIVNMSHIDTVDYPNMEIRLMNGELIKISRGYKKEFGEAYLRYTRSFS